MAALILAPFLARSREALDSENGAPVQTVAQFYFGTDTHKYRFWYHFSPPFWSLLGTLVAHVQDLGRQKSEKNGSNKWFEKKSDFGVCSELRAIPGNGGVGPLSLENLRSETGN